MEIIEVKKKAFVLDIEELTALRTCFDYLYHRAGKHPESYVSKYGIGKFIDYFRRKLKEV